MFAKQLEIAKIASIRFTKFVIMHSITCWRYKLCCMMGFATSMRIIRATSLFRRTNNTSKSTTKNPYSKRAVCFIFGVKSREHMEQKKAIFFLAHFGIRFIRFDELVCVCASRQCVWCAFSTYAMQECVASACLFIHTSARIRSRTGYEPGRYHITARNTTQSVSAGHIRRR